MSDLVHIGILGGGGILGAHAPALAKMADRCRVVAVAEPDPSRADRIRQLLGPDVAILPHFDDVVCRDDVEAVDVLLPHDLHLPATQAAARAGKHVLVEKVMARNVYECDRMIEACEAAGVTLTVCHDRRYHGEWQALKQIIDAGMLGETYFWRLEHTQNVAPGLAHWIASRDRLGGGAVMSCLTHQIDALRWYGGEVTEVTAMTRVVPERMEGESIGVVLARLASGALAQLTINWMTRANTAPNGLWYELNHVTGSRGEAYYQAGRGTFVLQYGEPAVAPAVGFEAGSEAGNAFRKVVCAPHTGHDGCIREWVRLLCGEPAAIVTSGRQVRGTVEVAEAAYLSEATGRTVLLPITPRPWSPS